MDGPARRRESLAQDPLNPAHTMNEIIGYLAASLTTLSVNVNNHGTGPLQALHTFRTRDVGGISLGMYATFTTGVALWLVYGILIAAWPIVAANAVTLLLALAILVMKLRYGRKP